MPDEQPPYGSENRTVICTVVFIDLVAYSQQAVAQQVQYKRHLNAMINRALATVAESDRLALDTGDGAALCFFGDPEDALFAAANLRQAVRADPGPGLQVRIGINLGPTRIVRDLNGNRNLIGDGINVAQRVMSFAAPNQILVSRSFFEVVSRLSEEYARLFQYAGLHKDKHVREHELYEVHGGAATGDAPEVAVEPAAAPAVPGPPPVDFPPELVTRMTRALTAHLGPMAKVVVQRAAHQARDRAQLLAFAAESLTGPARDRFLAEMSAAPAARPPAAPAPPTARSAPPPSERRPPRAPAPITSTVLATAEELLARHVGPIARLLVAKAAKEAADTVALADRLAAHIDDQAKREAFLAAMDQAGASGV
jgi:class 3 adenylate cyclase